MELQCKERVDLLEALKNSREEAKENADKDSSGYTLRKTPSIPKNSARVVSNGPVGWLGQGTVPPVNYPDLSKPGPALPQRPKMPRLESSESHPKRVEFGSQRDMSHLPSPHSSPQLPKPPKEPSRTPSPERRNRLRTTLRPPTKDGKRPSKSRESIGRKTEPPAASKAAGLAWDSISRSGGLRLGANRNDSTVTLNTGDTIVLRRAPAIPDDVDSTRSKSFVGRGSTPDPISIPRPERPRSYHESPTAVGQTGSALSDLRSPSPVNPEMVEKYKPLPAQPKLTSDYLSYRHEYPSALKSSPQAPSMAPRQRSPQRKSRNPVPPPPSRRPVANVSSPRTAAPAPSSGSEEDSPSRTPDSGSLESTQWEERVAYIKKHLPKGVDETAAKQIFNEIVVHGDEVHWEDVAGLEPAKKALKEAVVYPFLRPDLFMGLREPARGMLLFGPPGTGKTMLARAVATESRSTFFAISASSLTSKWLGESEKLVRALFALAKALAPSIIFVDEIDSLLSSRGGSSEHESTRRIKTEFLIQWSDLQRAAAGKEQTEKEKKEGDASRVLVLAATNLPWAIDEAARRRFVRRQYIPLPEGHVRGEQLRTLLSHQKHSLSEQDIQVLVELTEGTFFSFLFPTAPLCLLLPLPSPPPLPIFPQHIAPPPLSQHITLHPATPLPPPTDLPLPSLQASPAATSPPSPKTPPWAPSGVSAKHCCTCGWMRSDLLASKTSRRVWLTLGRV